MFVVQNERIEADRVLGINEADAKLVCDTGILHPLETQVQCCPELSRNVRQVADERYMVFETRMRFQMTDKPVYKPLWGQGKIVGIHDSAAQLCSSS